ncbi:MAG: hypothetical protein WCO12_01330 [bacterium]
MQLSEVNGGEVTLGVSYVEADGVKFIDLGTSKVKFDPKNPPSTKDGRVFRATFKKGLLTAETPKDVHTTGVLIQALICNEVRKGNFCPGLVDQSYMGDIDGRKRQFHAMNGSSRMFHAIESPTEGFRVLYQNGVVVIENMSQMEIASAIS